MFVVVDYFVFYWLVYCLGLSLVCSVFLLFIDLVLICLVVFGLFVWIVLLRLVWVGFVSFVDLLVVDLLPFGFSCLVCWWLFWESMGDFLVGFC